MTDLKLGKASAVYSAKDLLFTEFVEHKLQLNVAPVNFGVERSKLIQNWGMLANDEYGDCVWAGAAHEHLLWATLGGHKVSFLPENVLSDYAAVTGFDPATGDNDNGTMMRDAMNYRRKTGVLDSMGHRHKIGGFCALEPGNWTQLLQALNIFDAVAIGVEVPSSAMDQFRANKPWTVVAGSHVVGGHYIPVISRPGQLTTKVVTWSRLQSMTQAFYSRYNDESYGLFSIETLVAGKSPEGFNLADFRAAISQLAH